MIALVFTAGITLSIGQGVRLLVDTGFCPGFTATAGTRSRSADRPGHPDGRWQFSCASIWFRGLVKGSGADLRNAVFEHIVTLHPSYFETNRSGEIISRLTTDTTLLQSIIGSSFSLALRSTITLTGALIMLLVTNVKLTALVLSCVPLVLVPILLFGKRVKRLSRRSQASIADVGTFAGDIVQQIKTVQSYTREAHETRSFTTEVERAFQIAIARVTQRAWLNSVVIFLVFSALSAMLWVGGNDVINGTMSAGELAAFVFYAMLVAMAVATISEVYGELQRAAGAAERLFDLMQAPSMIAAPSGAACSATKTEATLAFDNVTFYYPSRPQTPALERFTLHIEDGQSLALVGPSGGGKSTVFELLQRFYDPQIGAVRLGDIDIRHFDPADLRRQLAVVAQQPSLFSSDVAYNIRYGKPDASDAEVIAAAKAAYAHDFITALPEGYDSFLGEHGVRLSAGQRQRIAIARAILKGPRVLLLDEATSALDAESEHQVQKAIDALMGRRTVVIIAHRLATVQHVDRIALIDSGQVVAIDSHNNLLANSELYRRFAELQFRDDASSRD